MPFTMIDSASAMRVLGALSVIVGGLIAAVTGPMELSKGSWAAAYVVLVAGVAQVAMGSALQRWRRGRGPAKSGPAQSGSAQGWPAQRGPAQGWLLLACWNLGNIAVIGGTVTASTLVVIAGSVLLVVALALAFIATMRPSNGDRGLLLLAYRVLLLLLAVSIPVGVVLSSLRAV